MNETATAKKMPLLAVPCSVCEQEVPVSEVMSFEASDYMLYFCGLDCYQRWLDEGGAR